MKIMNRAEHGTYLYGDSMLGRDVWRTSDSTAEHSESLSCKSPQPVSSMNKNAATLLAVLGARYCVCSVVVERSSIGTLCVGIWAAELILLA